MSMLEPESVSIAYQTMLATVIGTAFVGLSILTAAQSQRRQSRVESAGQRLTCLTHCNERYDNIYRSKIELNHEIELISKKFLKKSSDDLSDAVSAYFARFWGLQADQFDYWVNGWLDSDTVFSWYYILATKAFNKEEAFGIKYVDSWTLYGRPEFEYGNPWFCEFFDKLVEISQSNPKAKSTRVQILEFMEAAEPRILHFQKINRGQMRMARYRKNRDKALTTPLTKSERLEMIL